MANKGKGRSGAKKRFKVTGSGKLMRRQGRFTHMLTKKTSTRKRRVTSEGQVAPGDCKAVRRMLST